MGLARRGMWESVVEAGLGRKNSGHVKKKTEAKSAQKMRAGGKPF